MSNLTIRSTHPNGANDRHAEIPWLRDTLRGQAFGAALDVGSADAEYISLIPASWLMRIDVRVAPGVDLVTDAEFMPFPDSVFDLVTCISVIEHVGMGVERGKLGAVSTGFRKPEPGKRLPVMHAMHRVLKPGGWLLLTAPYGRYENHGWLEVFDTRRWLELWSSVAWARNESTFFKLVDDVTWQQCEPGDLRTTGMDTSVRGYMRAQGLVCAKLVK